MIISYEKPLLSEQLRPQYLGELNLPDHLIRSLQRMVESRTVMNLLFYGKPGIGKTSAARILIKEINSDVMELNGSFNNGEKTLINNIQSFATSVSILKGPKICFIDEADFLPRPVQESLRYIIENVSSNARFILTANDETRLSPAIRSRCASICFDVSRKESEEIISKMVERYESKLQSLEIKYDPARLREIVGIYFPDLRTISNRLELEFV